RAPHRPYRAAERAWTGQGRAAADRASGCLRRKPRGLGGQARPLTGWAKGRVARCATSPAGEQRHREVGEVMPPLLRRPEADLRTGTGIDRLAIKMPR